MTRRLGSFSADLARFADNAPKLAQEVRRRVIIELFGAVIMDTPVLSGRLRANWQLSANTPAAGTREAFDEGDATRAKVAAGVHGRDGVQYLTNNLPYAHRVEFEGWSHTKAPEGMVRRNVARITRIIKRANRGT